MSQKVFESAKNGDHNSGVVFIDLVKVTTPTPVVGGSTVLNPQAPTTVVSAVDGIGFKNEQADAALSSLAFDYVNGKVYIKIANNQVAADWKELSHAA